MPIKKQKAGANSGPPWRPRGPLSGLECDLLSGRDAPPADPPVGGQTASPLPRLYDDPAQQAVADVALERGRGVESLVAIADALGMDVEFLLTSVIATELRRRGIPKNPGRPADDSTTAQYALYLLEEYARGAALMEKDAPKERFLSEEDLRRVAELLPRYRYPYKQLALRLVREDFGDALSLSGSLRDVKKQLRRLASGESERLELKRWIEVRDRAADLIKSLMGG